MSYYKRLRHRYYLSPHRKKIHLALLFMVTLLGLSIHIYHDEFKTLGNIGLGFFLLCMAALILLASSMDKLPKDIETNTKVFKFKDQVPIVLACFLGQDGMDTAPYSDEKASRILSAQLDGHGLSNMIRVCTHKDARGLDDKSLIVIGGPLTNTHAMKINEALQQAPWFKGFYFQFHTPLETVNPRGDDETPAMTAIPRDNINFSVCHNMVDTFCLPHTAVTDQDDFAVIYVGPNPLDASEWLIWMAGIRAPGTCGACKCLTIPDFITSLAGCLSEDGKSYCSVLVHYHAFHLPDHVSEGKVIVRTLSTGRVEA